MSKTKAQRRKLLLMVAAVAFVLLCFVTSSSSLNVSLLDLNNFSGLFDPRPEELDVDLQESTNEADLPDNSVKPKKNPQKQTGGKENKNPGGYLGDISEIDQQDELPKTNADDVDLEEQGDSKSDSGDFVLPEVNLPVSIPELAYPTVPEMAGLTITKPLYFLIYSHNIKNGGSGSFASGETPWEERRSDIVASIKLHMGPNMVVVLQEALDFQLQYVLDQLNVVNDDKESDWVALGGGRINGKSKGEHVPIIVRRSDWEVEFSDMFWLNEGKSRTPAIGWDAKYPRTCTYATLKNKDTGVYLNMFNTHLDHKGKTARIESAKLIVQKMKNINQWPSLLAGDFNSMPNDQCHQYLTGSLKDVHDLTSTFNRYGHREFTVTGFLGSQLNKGERIDYIFAPIDTKKITDNKCSEGEKLHMQLDYYAVLHSKYGGAYMSDHRPVMAQFKISGC